MFKFDRILDIHILSKHLDKLYIWELNCSLIEVAIFMKTQL